MENPLAFVEGMPLWGKILLGVVALVLLLLVWHPWSSTGTAAASTTAAAPASFALPNTLMPGQQNAIIPTPGATVTPPNPGGTTGAIGPPISSAPTTSTVGGIAGVETPAQVSYKGYQYQPYIFPAGTTELEAAQAIYGAGNASAAGVLGEYNPAFDSPVADVGGETVYVPSAAGAPVL